MAQTLSHKSIGIDTLGEWGWVCFTRVLRENLGLGVTGVLIPR